jgi:hypothetical protein
MSISGLIVTLPEDAALRQEALALLGQRPELELGPLAGRWLPVVMETDSEGSSRTLHRWIESLPGVAYVDVAAVGFEESNLMETSEDCSPVPHLNLLSK